MIFEGVKYKPQVTHVIILTLGVYQNIINKNSIKLIKIIPKHSIHKVHESC